MRMFARFAREDTHSMTSSVSLVSWDKPAGISSRHWLVNSNLCNAGSVQRTSGKHATPLKLGGKSPFTSPYVLELISKRSRFLPYQWPTCCQRPSELRTGHCLRCISLLQSAIQVLNMFGETAPQTQHATIEEVHINRGLPTRKFQLR